MAKALSDTTYCSLRDEISAIYVDSRQQAAHALNHVLNKAHWEIGKRIVTIEQKNNIRAEYGERLLEHLSKDLTKKHGNGFSVTNLRYMRRFFSAYPIQHPGDELDWSHYKLLCAVKDKEQRNALAHLAVTKNLSKEDLRQAIRRQKVAMVSLRMTAPVDKKRACKGITLHHVRGRIGFYRTVVFEGLHIQRKECYLDLGFNVYRKNVAGITRRGHGDMVEAVGNTCVRPARGAGGDDLYTYKAYVDRVVDGDTVWVDADLGFGVFVRQKLRLRGIDAPEVNTGRGEMAKGFLRRTLDAVEYIVIRTHGADKYDRYLVDIFYLPGEADAARVAGEGVYLNQEMLDQGLAGLYLAEG